MSASTADSEDRGCLLDPLVNKTIDFAYRSARLKFDLSHALFSSFDIDAGTRFLLKEIAHEPGITGARRVLDSGCGTGIIGISLAASSPDMDVVMRDRDFRAVAFSARNAARNGLSVRIFGIGGELDACHKHAFAKIKTMPRAAGPLIAEPGLLGQPDARGPYDAVVSNLPAKAGPKLLARYFSDVRKSLLRPGGTFAFVIVTPLAEGARAWCSDAGLEVVRAVSTKNHMVCIARAPAAARPGDAQDWFSRYIRSRVERGIAGATLAWSGIQGLPEFDEPSYATVCALALAQKVLAGQLVRRALVIEPGVGIVPLWIRKVLGTEEIVLRSHDTLALAASLRNLNHAYPGPGGRMVRMLEPLFPHRDPAAALSADFADECEPYSIDAIMLFPEDIPGFDISSRYWPVAERSLKRGGVFIIAGDSTQTDRAAHQRPSGFSRLPYSERKKGWESIAFRRD